MKLLLLFGIFFTVISYAYALRCYVCAGSSKSDCALFKPTSMVIQDCKPMIRNMTSDKDLIPQCIKFYETEHYNPKMYVRACVLIPESVKDGCSYISKYVTVEGCATCTTDLCNKG